MERSLGSLIALTLACTVAATIFGFGSEVFSWRSVYEGLGREGLIQTSRLFVYLAATSAEWALYPFAYAWAAIDDPAGYADKFGGVGRPPYTYWTTYDILGVGISAALAQGLRMMAHVNPREL
jgi:hypothetical protein